MLRQPRFYPGVYFLNNIYSIISVIKNSEFGLEKDLTVIISIIMIKE